MTRTGQASFEGTGLASSRAGLMAGGFFLASVFLLALCQVQDGDAFTHLAMGREIWRLGALPPVETLTYASAGQPPAETYRSWLFAAALQAAHLSAGISGVVLLKATLVTLGFLVLFLDALRPVPRPLVAACVLAPFVVFTRFRFVERPDLLLLLFLGLTTLLLREHLRSPRRLSWLLPVVGTAWANSHASLPLVLLPFGAFLGAGVARAAFPRARWAAEGSPTPRQSAAIALLLVLTAAATLLSPYGLSQWTLGAKAAGARWLNQEILELQPPTWATGPSAFVFPALAALSFLWAGRRALLVDLLLVAPVALLSFRSRRFFFVFLVVAAPVVARNVAAALEPLAERARPGLRRAAAALGALWLLVCPALVLARVPGLSDPEQSFGLGIRADLVPEGALRYLDRAGVSGRLFNPPMWGGYVAFRDGGRRVPFADGRHALPDALLEKATLARGRPSVLDELQRAFGFEAILLDYPYVEAEFARQFSETDLGLTHPGWALVFWDDVSLLYLRRQGRWGSLAERDGYSHVRPSSGTWVLDRGSDEAAARELRRNVADTGSSRGSALLGNLELSRGRPREALDAFARVRPTIPISFLPAKDAGTAEAYANLGDLPKAARWFRRAIAGTDSPAPALHVRLADVLLATGDVEEAVRELERALEQNPSLVSVYPRLAALYRRQGRTSEAEETERRGRRAGAAAEGEEHFRLGVKAYLAGRLPEAREHFLRSVETNPASPSALGNLGFVAYDLGDLNEAWSAQSRALRVDPGFANAHYGLAQVAERAGNPATARRHWAAYLALEPSGYYSRRAREALDRLDAAASPAGSGPEGPR